MDPACYCIARFTYTDITVEPYSDHCSVGQRSLGRQAFLALALCTDFFDSQIPDCSLCSHTPCPRLVALGLS